MILIKWGTCWIWIYRDISWYIQQYVNIFYPSTPFFSLTSAEARRLLAWHSKAREWCFEPTAWGAGNWDDPQRIGGFKMFQVSAHLKDRIYNTVIYCININPLGIMTSNMRKKDVKRCLKVAACTSITSQIQVAVSLALEKRSWTPVRDAEVSKVSRLDSWALGPWLPASFH